MTDKELMQLALYALGLAKSSHNMVLSSDPPQSAWRYYDVDMKLQETITALDKRLAQPVQEPVAHTLNCVCGAVWDVRSDGVEEMVHTPDTTPPQRKPLDKMTIVDLADQHLYEGGKIYGILEFARAIEYKHGINGKA